MARRLLVAGSVQLETGKGADGACKWDPIACQRASVDMRQGSPAAGLVRVPQWLGPVGLRVANQGPGIRWLAWPKHEPRQCKTARLGACAPQSRNEPHLLVLDDAPRPWHGGASQAQPMPFASKIQRVRIRLVIQSSTHPLIHSSTSTTSTADHLNHESTSHESRGRIKLGAVQMNRHTPLALQ